jgi:hypothetical protein
LKGLGGRCGGGPGEAGAVQAAAGRRGQRAGQGTGQHAVGGDDLEELGVDAQGDPLPGEVDAGAELVLVLFGVLVAGAAAGRRGRPATGDGSGFADAGGARRARSPKRERAASAPSQPAESSARHDWSTCGLSAFRCNVPANACNSATSVTRREARRARRTRP